MGPGLKASREKGSGEGWTKAGCQQKSWLYGNIISCPFGARLESVTKSSLAAIKLVL